MHEGKMEGMEMEREQIARILAGESELSAEAQIACLFAHIEAETKKPWREIDHDHIEACTAYINRLEQARPERISDDEITEIRQKNQDEVKKLILSRGDRMLFRQFLRQPVFLACTALLLVLAVSFACIGGAAVGGLLRQYAALEDNFTTIALPVVNQVGTLGDEWADDLDYNGYTDQSKINTKTGERRPSKLRVSRILDLLEAQEFIAGRDVRAYASVHIAGTQALAAADLPGYQPDFDVPGSRLVVLAVRCVGTDAKEKFVSNLQSDFQSYLADFVIEEILCADERLGLHVGEQITYGKAGVLMPFGEENKVPFKVGDRLIVRGIYSPDDPSQNRGIEQPGVLLPYALNDLRGKTEGRQLILNADGSPAAEYNNNLPNYTLDFRLDDEGDIYGYTPADSWPYFTLLGEGSVADALAANPVWVEEIIPHCQYNYASAGLMLTDNADALYPINAGRVYLRGGRMITEAEYAAGARVCLIGAEYADRNGIAVGDTLTLAVHETGYASSVYRVENESGYPMRVDGLSRYPMIDYTQVETAEYTVVGILGGMATPLSSYGLRPDTILAPKGSLALPGKLAALHPESELLETLIVRNGHVDDLEALLTERLAPGYFRYYDGGYGAVIDSMAGLRLSAVWMLVAGVGAFVLAASLAGWLIRRRMLAPVRTMRLLGVSRPRVWCSAVGVMLVLCLVALPLGTLCGGLLYETVAGALLSASIELEPRELLFCAALLGALLLAGSVGLSLELANIPLMRGGRRRKGKINRHAMAAMPRAEVYIPPKAVDRTRLPAVKAIVIAPDAREKKLSPAMLGLFFRVLLRRVMVSLLLMLLSGFGVFAALFLDQAVMRQEKALEDALDHIEVKCTVTSSDGVLTDGINLSAQLLPTLRGVTGEGLEVIWGEKLWGERAPALAGLAAEHITDLRAMAVSSMAKHSKTHPDYEEIERRIILNLASDPLLAEPGVKVSFIEGWDETAFADQIGLYAVCLITPDVKTETDADGREYVAYNIPGKPNDYYRLQVIGRVEGVGETMLWTPMGLQIERNGRSLLSLTNFDSCSFVIADNRRLEEARAFLLGMFFDATLPEMEREFHDYGIIIDDADLLTVQRELTATLALLRWLTPMLIALYAAIGFFGSYLPVRGRVREFAVMRCLGRSRGRVFVSVFGETICLALVGAGIGLAAAACAGRITAAGLGGAVLVLCMFLGGAAMAAWQVTQVDLMQAMKGED